MKYTREQLKSLILPMLDTLTAPDVGQKQVEACADAIIQIIEQDRDAQETSHD